MSGCFTTTSSAYSFTLARSIYGDIANWPLDYADIETIYGGNTFIEAAARCLAWPPMEVPRSRFRVSIRYRRAMEVEAHAD